MAFLEFKFSDQDQNVMVKDRSSSKDFFYLQRVVKKFYLFLDKISYRNPMITTIYSGNDQVSISNKKYKERFEGLDKHPQQEDFQWD